MNNKTTLFLLIKIILCLLLANYSLAQGKNIGEIRGKITEDITGKSITFAKVTAISNGIRFATLTDFEGLYTLDSLKENDYKLEVIVKGYQTRYVDNVLVTPNEITFIDVQLERGKSKVPKEVLAQAQHKNNAQKKKNKEAQKNIKKMPKPTYAPFYSTVYKKEDRGTLIDAQEQPVAAFSPDVATNSYDILNAYIAAEQLPTPESIHLEELINYFNYEYIEVPVANHPFSVNYEIGECPWNKKNKLLLLHLKSNDMDAEKVAAQVNTYVHFDEQQVISYRLLGYKMRAGKYKNDNTNGDWLPNKTCVVLYEMATFDQANGVGQLNITYYDETFRSDKKITFPLRVKKDSPVSTNFRWAAAVAAYTLKLQDDKGQSKMTYNKILSLARSATDIDLNGKRQTFIELMDKSSLIKE